MEKYKNMTSLLNIGAGKPDLGIDFSEKFIINLDRNYFTGFSPEYAEEEHRRWLSGKADDCMIDVKYDIFEFLKTYKYKFNGAMIYRYYEHVQKNDILFFIYLLSTVIETGGIVDLISPDFKLLSNMIINEDVNNPDFDKNDIILSTEIFNEDYDKHGSITTIDRTKYFFEYEGRFKVIDSVSPCEYDGRDIYFRSIIKRI